MSEQRERSENPELTPAILTELRTTLLQRQADLQRQVADLRQNLSAPVDPLDTVEIDAPGDEGDASVDLQDREDSDQLLLELHVLLPESAYGPNRDLADRLLARLGIETEYYDPLLGAELRALIRDNTQLIWCESPGSVTMEVQDVPAITAVARDAGVVRHRA